MTIAEGTLTVVEGTEDRTIATPAATMVGLAAPSQGSKELSTWRVEMTPGMPAPPHAIDREQVWMPIQGTFEFTVGTDTATVSAGQALIVPADTERTFHAVDGPAQALVCMAPGGAVTPGGATESQLIPWAA